ncbi:MAG: DUF2510 domain-containing protein [Actinomycetota bacterium]|nr:DUF2510 domain-containing protein [Actinomycetota bacterium]
MTDRPIDSGWWLATDGNWYPPAPGADGPPPTPAGWYHDPCGGGQRYWDGDAWTAVVRDADGAGPVSHREALDRAIEALDGTAGAEDAADGAVVELVARRTEQLRAGDTGEGIGELDPGAVAAWDAFVSLDRPEDEVDEAGVTRVFRRRRSA